MPKYSALLHALASTLLLACTPLASASDASSPAPVLALDKVRIVDAERDQLSPPRCVRIEGAHITDITRPGSRRCRRGARILDLDGRYLLPGLIDMHAHLALGPLELRQEQGELSIITEADDEIAAHNADRLVAFGVTTIRDPGGDLAAVERYRMERATGELVGPESFHAGPVINDVALPGLAVAVDSAEEMHRQVGEQVEAGADWIKLYTGLSPELLAAGIEAAHAHHRPAVAHLDDVSWADALELGLDALVHLMPTSPDMLTPEARAAWQATARPGGFAFFEWWEHFDSDGPAADRLVAAFEDHKPVFDATLVAFHAAFVQDLENDYKQDARRYAHPRLVANWEEWFTFAIGWEPEDFERARAVWPKIQRMAVRLYATDARLTVGTDMSNPWIAPGISLHREMALLAEAGVPTASILAAATTNAADALGAGGRLGRIKPGFEADLVVLDADPLVDIRHTRRIHAVILDGRFIDAGELAELKGE